MKYVHENIRQALIGREFQKDSNYILEDIGDYLIVYERLPYLEDGINWENVVVTSEEFTKCMKKSN